MPVAFWAVKQLSATKRWGQHLETLRVPRQLDQWLGNTFPEHTNVYWGCSGATLIHDALQEERRKTMLLPAFTCPTLVTMAMATGMRVILVDVDRSTLHPSLEALEQCLKVYPSNETVLLVDHTFGYLFRHIVHLRQTHPGLLIIEDCVRALGGTIDGIPVGRTGDWALHSLYKTVQGNNHGAVLLTRSPYSIRSGPAPKTTWRQLTSTLRPLRIVYECFKRRRPDFSETPRNLIPPVWEGNYGVPNNLCLKRFSQEITRLPDDVGRRQEAFARLSDALESLSAISLIRGTHRSESGASFLSFTVCDQRFRNQLLEHLHREGHFLLRTWDLVPAFFKGLSATFPCGAGGSVDLADHVVHIPVQSYVNPDRSDQLVRRIRTYASRSAVSSLSVSNVARMIESDA